MFECRTEVIRSGQEGPVYPKLGDCKNSDSETKTKADASFVVISRSSSSSI